MNIALNSGIFPGNWSPAQKLEATARVGAAGLELNLDAGQLWIYRLDAAARRQLAQQARDSGVAWTSLCMNAHWIFNLASPDVRIRDLGVGFLLDAIDLAHELGAKAILVPGCDQEESPENRWDLFRDGVMQAVAKAQAAGVTLAIEAVGKPFLYNTAKIVQMIDACGGGPALGVYLDIGNSTHGGMDPVTEVLAARGKAAGVVHVKDWDPETQSSANPKPRRLGDGAVNFPGSLAALREIGYAGYLVVELSPDPLDPEAIARHSMQFLQNALR